MPRPLRRTLASLAPVLAAAGTLCVLAAPVQAHRFAETTQPPAGEGSGEPPHRGGRCTLSLQATPSGTVASGGTVDLQGQMTCPEAAEAEGRPVTILARERGSGQKELTTVTTGAEGDFEASEPVTANTVFIAHAFRARRARAAVKVGAAVTLAGPTGAAAALFTRGGYRHGAQTPRITFSGTVAPAAADIPVALQRRYVSTGEPWHTIAFARTDETGAFTFTRRFRSGGQVDFRAVAHVRGHVRSYSPELTYTVAQAQSTTLTIAAASDPLPAGQSTTISGVLAAGAGHAVVLIARTAGHPFMAVASTQSGEGGAYTFTVAPTVNTTYRVLSGKADSTPLFLGIMPALTLQAPPASATVGQPVSFAGTLTGAPADSSVRLESEQSGGGFWTIESVVVQPDGSFTLTRAFQRPGTYTLRVSAPHGPEEIGATSQPFTLKVAAPAPAPEG